MSNPQDADIYEEIFGTESDTDDDEELHPIGKTPSKKANNTLTMLQSKSTGEPEKDIVTSYNDKTDTIDENKLESIHQHTLNEIYRVIGRKKLTRNKMDCASAWILDKALKEELEANWKDTHTEVDERDIEENANIIPSHVVYKLKSEEKDIKRMKAILCPNGNRDRLKKTV